MKKVTAYIIVGWNNEDILQECFKSVKNQTYSHKKIIYVDNDSKDNSVDLVKKKFPGVKIIQPGTNTGFARGNNLAVTEALKDQDVGYIVLLNSDARLHEEWTSKIVNLADQKPKGALFQGTTFDYYDHSIIDSTHIFIARNGQGTQGSWRNPYTHDKGPSKVFGVNAAACLIKRKFLEAQPFDQMLDERMFMYLEDVDLSTRATVMGWDNYLVRGAKAYHMGSVSSGKNPGFSLYMTFRNNTALLVKNLPIKILLRILPGLIRGDIDTFRALRRQGNSSASWKIVKGRLVGVFRSVLYLRKRHIMKSHRDIDSTQLWDLMNKGL